jgi:hypothetical protein
MRVTIERLIRALCLIGLLAACAEEPPPPSVTAFMENPTLLDATMVRCAQNRAEKKYDPECVNAREAVDRAAVAAEKTRREQLDAQFERKRQALRRAQEAAAEARRRASETEALRQEAEYLSQFGAAPEGPAEAAGAAAPGDPAGGGGTDAQEATVESAPPGTPPTALSAEEPAAAGGTDLEAVRDALQQRQEEAQQ